MADRLKDKVAVVTGAGRGIGRAIALAMADEGAKVVVNDWGGKGAAPGAPAGNADKVVAEIKIRGGSAVAQTDNVAITKGGERIIQTAVDSFGSIDILVNNAGITHDHMVWNMTEEEWDAVLDVNLKGTFNCTRAASVIMKRQRYGRILSIISGAGFVGNTGACNYCASKAGIVGLMNTVARDLGYYGVTTNMIAPVAQPDELREAGKQYVGMPTFAAAIEQRAKYGIKRLYAGPGATGNEWTDHVAPLAVFLASDAAANINGQLLGIRGETVEVWTQHRIIRTIFDRTGKWSADNLCRIMPYIMADIFNFAPAQKIPTEKQSK